MRAVAPTPPDPLTVYNVATVRHHADAWQGQRLTVQGVVTSVEGSGATVQSGGRGLRVEGAEAARLAQAIITTGTLTTRDGNLALTALEEWLVEQPQVALPEPEPLTADSLEDSRYVRINSAVVETGGQLRWADGVVAVRALDDESARRLADGTRLDWVSGVLRQSPTGWSLLPPHPRDIVVAPPRLTLCEIQGDGRSTLYGGLQVESEGIVTLVPPDEAGWFLQHPDCDGDPATSDALWVAADGPMPEVGDWLRLRGRVDEFYGRTQLVLAGDWLSERQVALPDAVPLAPPVGDARAAQAYWEALEGMYVQLAGADVVGPTSRYGEFAVLPAGAVDGRLWADSPALTQRLLVADDPAAPTPLALGDRVTGLTGPLDFTFGTFKLRPSQPFKAVIAPLPPLPTLPPLPDGAWRLATLNLENLFDTVDDPATADEDWTLTAEQLDHKLDKLAGTIAGPMALPTILAVQEVENLVLLEQLAAHPLLGPRYRPMLVEGVDERGIDVGLLIDIRRAELIDQATANPCSTERGVGGGPAADCPAGQRLLFARPPLVVALRVDGAPLYVIVVHFKSMRGGESESQPRRSAQARFVAELVEQLRRDDPDAPIAVLGDFNSDADGVTVANLLHDAPLASLWQRLPREQRHAYLFEGVSQTLDHILVTPELFDQLIDFRPLALNADYPHSLSERTDTLYRSSDHDPIIATFAAPK